MTDDLDARAAAEGRATARRLKGDPLADGKLERELRGTIWDWVKTEPSPRARTLWLGFWGSTVAGGLLIVVGAYAGQSLPPLGTSLAVLGIALIVAAFVLMYFARTAGDAASESAALRRNDLLRQALNAASAELSTGKTPKRPAAPAAQAYGVSHGGAEAFVADWMRHLGARDVAVTRLSQDGGIDVTSTTHIAQVKNYAGSVGVPAIREMVGVASIDGRKPLVFTSGTYTAESIRTADAAGMPLFVYDAPAGTLTAVNPSAKRLLDDGM